MERMQSPMGGHGETAPGDLADALLDSLFKEYREACPDPEPSAQFTPSLWARIETRRKSSSWLRRYAEICVAATLAVALLLAIFVIPSYQEVAFEHYVDVLAAADSARDATPLPMNFETAGELE